MAPFASLLSLLSTLLIGSIVVNAAPLALPEQNGPVARASQTTFVNPVLEGARADPWVIQFDGAYYLLPTMPDGSISVYKSKTLTDFHSAQPIQVVKPSGVWAPEMHVIDGELWIYAATQDGDDAESDRRMHAYKGTDSKDPTKPFEDKGVVTTPDKNFAIDGTVLREYGPQKKNYFIWSGKRSPSEKFIQYLYIAEMSSPTTLIGERTLIHSPFKSLATAGAKLDWQWSGDHGVNEGPEILVHDGKVMLIYSACGSWTECYSLGLMYLDGNNKNPLNPADWVVKDDAPIFASSDKTLGVGHASFPYDADGTPFVVYHGWNTGDKGGWGARTTRAQSYTWNADGTPKFADPATAGVSIAAAVAL